MGFGLPSWSDVKNTVSSAANTVTSTVSSAASSARDLGGAALQRGKELAADGVDLGRRAVNAVRSVDVREAASVVRAKISEGTEAARDGIKTGVEWSGRTTHTAAEFARNHVPGGDNPVSNAVRGAITAQEDATRFSLGVVGGVSREVVGLAGTVGELGTTAVEMQVSPEARAEYGQKLADGAVHLAETGANYAQSVARDPSRLGSDISGAADAAKTWGSGQIDRYEQAFRDGKGFETVGMDVGTVATYVVPVGGGPVRGAVTAAVRGGTEAAVRGGSEALARGGAETLARGGTEVAVRGGTEAAVRGGTEASVRAVTEGAGRTGSGALVRTAVSDGGSAAARGGEQALVRETAGATTRAGETAAREVSPSGATAPVAAADAAVGPIASGRGVFFVDSQIVPYLDKVDATLGQPGAHFFMPLEDSKGVVDAASAYRYTGGAPAMGRAYTGGGEVFGVDFPLAGMTPRVPTAADAGGYVHYLEGGHTALRLGDGGGFLVNETREFVVPGGGAMPAGSTLFRLAEDGSRVPMRSW